MEIVKAGESDSDRIAPLFDRYRRFYGKPGDLESARRFLRARLIARESVVFFAALEDRVLGFVQLYPSFSSLSLKPLWTLNDLYVEPDARRRAIGSRLLARAEDHARETRARGLTLKTAMDNASARSLYEARGWRRDDAFLSFDLVIDQSAAAPDPTVSSAS